MTKQADIVRAEVAGDSWLARNWRPLLMINFGFLISARMLGLTAPGIGELEWLKLWSILELGIGGYIGGRTLEKVTPQITQAFQK